MNKHFSISFEHAHGSIGQNITYTSAAHMVAEMRHRGYRTDFEPCPTSYRFEGWLKVYVPTTDAAYTLSRECSDREYHHRKLHAA